MALNGLRFLAADGERLQRFLDVTGLSAQDLRKRAAEPDFLAGILDYLLSDESLLLAFTAEEGISPEMPAIARRLLPGAASC